MKLSLVPFAITLAYHGRNVAAIGLPLGWMFPALVRWLEDGVKDL